MRYFIPTTVKSLRKFYAVLCYCLIFLAFWSFSLPSAENCFYKIEDKNYNTADVYKYCFGFPKTKIGEIKFPAFSHISQYYINSNSELFCLIKFCDFNGCISEVIMIYKIKDDIVLINDSSKSCVNCHSKIHSDSISMRFNGNTVKYKLDNKIITIWDSLFADDINHLKLNSE